MSSDSRNTTKEQRPVRINSAEDESGIEVSLKEQISAARRRWILLRNVHMGIRRTSLTEPEKELLQKINNSGNHRNRRLPGRQDDVGKQKKGDKKQLSFGEVDVDGAVVEQLHKVSIKDDDDNSNKKKKKKKKDDDEVNFKKSQARQKLRQSIAQKKSLLTDVEVSFLESLCDDSVDVSTEELERTDNVLNRDKIYSACTDGDADDDDDDDNADHKQKDDQTKATTTSADKSRRKSLQAQNQHDPSFRLQLWRSLQASTHHMGNDNDVDVDDDDDSREEFVLVQTPKTARHNNNNNKKKKKKERGFVYFLTSVFGGADDRDNRNNNNDHKDDGPPPPLSETVSSTTSSGATPSSETTGGAAITFSILGTSVDDTEAHPHVLSPPLMDSLRPFMPYVVQEDNFWLKYSLVRDGASTDILLDYVRSSARTVLAIETVDGEVFGSFTSSPWRRNGNHYYGSGESFLWRMRQSRFAPCRTVLDQAQLESDVEIYKWTGENRNVQLANSKKLIVGGGEPPEKKKKTTQEKAKIKEWGFGIALNSDLSSGTSGFCVTFGSPGLCRLGPSGDVFEVSNLEVWTMTPVTTIEQAEKLELARQFVFDHGRVLDD